MPCPHTAVPRYLASAVPIKADCNLNFVGHKYVARSSFHVTVFCCCCCGGGRCTLKHLNLHLRTYFSLSSYKFLATPKIFKWLFNAFVWDKITSLPPSYPPEKFWNLHRRPEPWFFQPSSSLPICHFYVLNFEFERRGQCDQIWRFFGLWATF